MGPYFAPVSGAPPAACQDGWDGLESPVRLYQVLPVVAALLHMPASPCWCTNMRVGEVARVQHPERYTGGGPLLAWKGEGAMRPLSAAIAGITATALLALAPTQGATAADGPEAPPASVETYTVSTATVETLDRRGRVLRTTEAGPELEGQWLPVPQAEQGDSGDISTAAWEDGFGGTSSASGCAKVTTHNKTYTTLGFLAFEWDVWTRFCWNRSQGRVYDIDRGYLPHSIDSQFIYRGIIHQDWGFFAWRSGYPNSGYYHTRTAHFENCVFKYGCIKSLYPRSLNRVRSDGTWYWATDG